MLRDIAKTFRTRGLADKLIGACEQSDRKKITLVAFAQRMHRLDLANARVGPTVRPARIEPVLPIVDRG
jgi:hypothetical protein